MYQRSLMLINPKKWIELQEKIKTLYLEGNSSQEIKDQLQLPHNVRQVQRWIKSLGISRTAREAFHNAMKRNRVTFVKKKNRARRTKRFTFKP